MVVAHVVVYGRFLRDIKEEGGGKAESGNRAGAKFEGLGVNE